MVVPCRSDEALSMSRKAPSLADFRRLVVKVGSSLLVDAPAGGNATLVAHEALKLAEEGLCSECGAKAVARRDFSQLASSTAIDEGHDLEDDGGRG